MLRSSAYQRTSQGYLGVGQCFPDALNHEAAGSRLESSGHGMPSDSVKNLKCVFLCGGEFCIHRYTVHEVHRTRKDYFRTRRPGWRLQ